MITQQQIDGIRVRLESTYLVQFRNEHSRAEIARDLLAMTGCELTEKDPRVPSTVAELTRAYGSGFQEAWKVARFALGQPKLTALCLFSMAYALEIVPNGELWRAVGWYGVRSLVGKAPAARAAAIRTALREAEKTRAKRLTRARVRQVCGAQPAAKDPSARPKGSFADYVSSGKAGPPDTNDAGRAEVVKAIQTHAPILLTVLSDAGRRFLGLSTPRKKTKTA